MQCRFDFHLDTIQKDDYYSFYKREYLWWKKPRRRRERFVVKNGKSMIQVVGGFGQGLLFNSKVEDLFQKVVANH